MSITKADVLAMIDVVNQLTNEIDDLSAADAIDLRKAVIDLRKAAAMCESLLETKAVNALDGQPIQVDGAVFVASSAATGKWRPDHTAIRRVIRDRAMAEAVNHETGEIEASVAVRVALDLLYMAYVSPAEMPKQTFLKELGISNKSIANYESGRKRLKEMQIEKEVDDG